MKLVRPRRLKRSASSDSNGRARSSATFSLCRTASRSLAVRRCGAFIAVSVDTAFRIRHRFCWEFALTISNNSLKFVRLFLLANVVTFIVRTSAWDALAWLSNELNG
jgi:hypothetical protein